MTKLINEGGIRYLDGLRSPPKVDPEVKKIAIELPDVPCLSKENNPCNWDLVFVCSDGIVYAHRIVISNVSKYISFMLDDQPTWLTTYVHVLDLPRFIVQLLVDLAYTGEMRFPEELQSDVFDAMQTLGWIHTDSLSAHFDGVGESYVYQGDWVKSPKKDEKPANAEKENRTEMKMSFLAVDKSPQRSRNSFAEEEDSMEISHLPEVDWSDKEDVVDKPLATSTSKKNAPVKVSARNSKTPSKAKTNDKEIKTLKKSESVVAAAPPAKKRSRRASLSESNKNSEDIADAEDAPSLAEFATEIKTKGKPGRKPKASTSVQTPAIKIPEVVIADETSQDSTLSEASTLTDSPTKRQRRKPKRFEEYEELDKPKPRASPSKPSDETKGARVKKPNSNSETVEGTVNSDNQTKEPVDNIPSSDKVADIIVKTPTSVSSANDASSSNKGKKVTSKIALKKRLSSEGAKSKLITSYFSKKEDTSDLGQEDDCEILDDEDISSLPTNSESETKKRGGTTALIKEVQVGKQEINNKRSFDDIQSSVSLEADKGDRNGNILDGEAKLQNQKLPARKSSRVSSKQSNDESEPKNDDSDKPKRKRIRKESLDVTGASTSDTTADPGGSGPPSRRSSETK